MSIAAPIVDVYGEYTVLLTANSRCATAENGVQKESCLIDYTDCRDLDGSEYGLRWFIEKL